MGHAFTMYYIGSKKICKQGWLKILTSFLPCFKYILSVSNLLSTGKPLWLVPQWSNHPAQYSVTIKGKSGFSFLMYFKSAFPVRKSWKLAVGKASEIEWLYNYQFEIFCLTQLGKIISIFAMQTFTAFGLVHIKKIEELLEYKYHALSMPIYLLVINMFCFAIISLIWFQM